MSTQPEREAPPPSEHTVYKATKTRERRAKEDLVVQLAVAWGAERSWRRRTEDAEGRLLAAIDDLLRVQARGVTAPLVVGERVRVQGQGAGELVALPKGAALVDLDDGEQVQVERAMVRRF